jgi:hypothetical protein
LRYVYIGSDEGSSQDPQDITKKWEQADVGMKFFLAPAKNFTTRHGQWDATSTNTTSLSEQKKKEYTHHHFIHRQRGFITECAYFMKKQGVHFTTFIDSDEFIVINRIGHDEEGSDFEPSGDKMFLNARKSLSLIEEVPTVMSAINALRRLNDAIVSPCYTMPRLLYGALENVTCPDAMDCIALAKEHFQYSDMSTLRFHQHAPKGDFKFSKFGKVIMNLSSNAIPEELIRKEVPRNIHRPWKEVCGPGVVNFYNSLFYVNHYIGSWERYSFRSDERRDRKEWEVRAFLTMGTSCDKRMHEWLTSFVDQVGPWKARFLLGKKK